MSSAKGAANLRSRTRDAVRERIADEALILFDQQGFDATTVEDIVVAVGISPRSFFRYFPSKEDVVVGDPLFAGAQLRDEVAKLLRGGFAPWPALTRALRAGAADVDSDSDRWLRVMRVVNGASSLRARNLEKHIAWSALLVPLLSGVDSLTSGLNALQARALVGAAFACLDAALATWTELGGESAFIDTLEHAFEAVSYSATIAE